MNLSLVLWQNLAQFQTSQNRGIFISFYFISFFAITIIIIIIIITSIIIIIIIIMRTKRGGFDTESVL